MRGGGNLLAVPAAPAASMTIWSGTPGIAGLASDLRMATIIREEGLSIAEAAERFAITTRTVFRVLRRCRNAMRELSPAEIEVFVALPAGRQHSGA